MKNIVLIFAESRFSGNSPCGTEKSFFATRIARLACVFAASLIFFGCAGAPAPKPVAAYTGVDANAAWENLWADRFSLAEVGFKDILESHPADGGATRGLALVHFAKGADEESATLLAKGLAAEPTSPFADAVQAFAIEVMPDGKKSIETLRKLAETESLGKMPWDTQRAGRKFLLDYYKFYEPNAAKITSLAESLKARSSWKIVGPFPNPSASGFSVDYVGETAMEFWGRGNFPATDGRSLYWTSPDLLPPDAVIRPEAYLGRERWGSVYYALNEFTSKTAEAYRIFVERSGAIAVWVDGKSVFSDAKERRKGEYRSQPLLLAAGVHKILVKLASEESVAGFRLSLIPDSEYGTQWRESTHLIARINGHVEGDSNEELGSAAAAYASRSAPDSAFWYARYLLDCGYADEALSVIANARTEGAEQSSLFDYLESRCLAALGRESNSRNALLRSSHRYVLFAPAVERQVSEQISERRFSEAKMLLAQSRSVLGKWRVAALKEIALAIAFNGDVHGKAAEYAKAYPDSPDAAILLATQGLGYGFDLRALIAEIRDKGNPYEADGLALGYASQIGAQADIFAFASSRAAIFPEIARMRFLVEDSSRKLGKFGFDEAIERAAKLALSFPGSIELAELAASLAEIKFIMLQTVVAESGDKANAKPGGQGNDKNKELAEAKEKYLEKLSALLLLRPSEYAFRKQWRSVKGLPDLDLSETVTSAEKTIAEYEKASGTEPSALMDAEIVLDETTTTFFGNGASRFYRLYILKLLSLPAVEAESSQNIAQGYGIQVTQAFTLKSDGSRVEARVGKSSVSYPGLSIGDCLVLRYQGNTYDSGALPKAFWHSVYLQKKYRAHAVKAKIVYPAEVELNFSLYNEKSLSLAKKEAEEGSGMRSLEIAGKDLPAIPSGPWAASPIETSAWLDLSSLKDWAPIASWYRDLFYGRAEPTEAIRQKAIELTKGIVERRAKIARLYDFVANAVNYEDLAFMYSAYVPQRAESVLEDRFGDCKDKCALLVSLLAACGIDSEVALSAPDYQGANHLLPSTRFNHVFVLVPDPEGDLILDATAQYSTFPNLPPNLQGTWYLPISRSGTLTKDLQRIPFSSTLPPLSVYLEVSLEENGRAAVRGSATMSGAYAAALREALAPRAESKRGDFAAWLAYSLLPGLKLAAFEAEGLEGGIENLDPVLNFEGSLPPPTAQGDIVALSLPWATRLPLPPELLSGSSAAALAIEYASFAAPVTETVVAKIPAGWSAESLPSDAELTFGNAYARFRYVLSGQSIVCERELYLPYLLVKPDERASFLAFVDAVAGKGGELLLLRK